MLVHNTIYKIIYKFFKIILLFYHFLCNLCLSHAAATLRNAYSFQVISILFLTKISLVWCQRVALDLHAVNREKKSIINVFLFRNNVRFVQVSGCVF